MTKTGVSNTTLKYSHSTNPGRSLIERIEIQMDKRRKAMERIMVEHGLTDHVHHMTHVIEQGRYEGLAAALMILRSSSVPVEISRSNERLGIE